MFYKKRLIDLREKYNLKQYEIARILNIAPTTYNNYENEFEIIPIKHLISLSNYFGVSIDYIFGFTDELNYKNNKTKINSNKVGKHLKEFRKKNKMTQSTLANFLNISQTTLSKIESGINLIATPFLYQICSKYHISADYLLGKTDEPKYLK